MEIKPVRELEGNRVELVSENKISKKSTVVTHFSVPKDKADEFSASYKKQRKNSTIFSLVGTGLSTLLGVYLGGKVAKKSILSWAGAVAGGIAFGLGALSIASRQVYKTQQRLFDKFDVQQISYLKEEETEAKSEPAPTAPSNK